MEEYKAQDDSERFLSWKTAAVISLFMGLLFLFETLQRLDINFFDSLNFPHVAAASAILCGFSSFCSFMASRDK